MSSIEQRIKDYKTGVLAGFNFWKPNKASSGLTLSVKINEQGGSAVENIKGVQDRIISKITNIKVINDPYDEKQNFGLYRYPEDKLHFSLVTFFGSNGEFDEFKIKIKKGNKIYSDIKDKAIKHIQNNILIRTRAKIKFLWHGDSKKIDSFTLQVFPEEKFITSLIKIADEASGDEKLLEEIDVLNFQKKIGVKGNPPYSKEKGGEPQSFSLNLLRFLDFSKNKNLDSILDSGDNILKREIEMINEEFMRNDEYFDLAINKIDLVESDPFLYKWNKIKEFVLK
jgi:hypothetical protein